MRLCAREIRKPRKALIWTPKNLILDIFIFVSHKDGKDYAVF